MSTWKPNERYTGYSDDEEDGGNNVNNPPVDDDNINNPPNPPVNDEEEDDGNDVNNPSVDNEDDNEPKKMEEYEINEFISNFQDCYNILENGDIEQGKEALNKLINNLEIYC
jgi:hypothetical protein